MHLQSLCAPGFSSSRVFSIISALFEQNRGWTLSQKQGRAPGQTSERSRRACPGRFATVFLSLLDSALTKTAPRNPFGICTYEKHRREGCVRHQFFPTLTRSPRRAMIPHLPSQPEFRVSYFEFRGFPMSHIGDKTIVSVTHRERTEPSPFGAPADPMDFGKEFSVWYISFLAVFRRTHYNSPTCPGCASHFVLFGAEDSLSALSATSSVRHYNCPLPFRGS